MPRGQGLSLNSLMKHMRKSGIAISGSAQKRQLLLSGYFHGYKGYRYAKSPTNKLPFHDFMQIQAVIDFDGRLKTALYTPIMRLETALKSIVCDIAVSEAGSDSPHVVMDKLMRSSNHSSRDYMARKCKMRDEIYSSLTRAYGDKKNNIVKHYYDKDEYVPLWAVFEVITLGQFGVFVNLLDPSIRLKISDVIGLPKNYNTDGALLYQLIFLLQDTRNAVAHDSVMFDARHHGNRRPGGGICSFLAQETLIKNITFDSIIDDVILILYLMMKLWFPKKLIYAQIRMIKASLAELQTTLGATLFMQIISGDAIKKLRQLESYIRKS